MVRFGDLDRAAASRGVYWEGLSDRNSLSEADRRRFDPMIGLFMSGVNQDHQFAQDGVIAPAVWDSKTRGVRWQFQQRGMQQYWDEWRTIYDDEFARFIDSLIRESEAAE
jgi:hypothetical protein